MFGREGERKLQQGVQEKGVQTTETGKQKQGTKRQKHSTKTPSCSGRREDTAKQTNRRKYKGKSLSSISTPNTMSVTITHHQPPDNQASATSNPHTRNIRVVQMSLQRIRPGKRLPTPPMARMPLSPLIRRTAHVRPEVPPKVRCTPAVLDEVAVGTSEVGHGDKTAGRGNRGGDLLGTGLGSFGAGVRCGAGTSGVREVGWRDVVGV